MSQSSQQSNDVSVGAVMLWASALLIFAMILMQASRLNGPGVAFAGNVSEVGDLTILTADAGNDEDLLLVLDSRADRLLVYGIANDMSLQLRANYEIAPLFQAGKAAGGRRSR
jgi:hypothetical protein